MGENNNPMGENKGADQLHIKDANIEPYYHILVANVISFGK